MRIEGLKIETLMSYTISAANRIFKSRNDKFNAMKRILIRGYNFENRYLWLCEIERTIFFFSI